MFANHQPMIARYALQSPENLRRVINFVICTIQQPLKRVPEQMADLDKLGERSRFLYASKRDAFIYARDHAAALYAEAIELSAIADPIEAERQLLIHFAAIPGIGLVKAGFIIQLVFGLGGCLDTHNIGRFGLTAGDLKSDRFKRPKTWAAKYRRLDIYQDILRALGGAETLWDSWCEFVAAKEGKYSQNFRDAFEVSEYHCIGIGIIKRTLSDAMKEAA